VPSDAVAGAEFLAAQAVAGPDAVQGDKQRINRDRP
jgi:hypothetical protein